MSSPNKCSPISLTVHPGQMVGLSQSSASRSEKSSSNCFRSCGKRSMIMIGSTGCMLLLTVCVKQTPGSCSVCLPLCDNRQPQNIEDHKDGLYHSKKGQNKETIS